MELVQTEVGIVQEYLSECDVTPIFEKWHHLFEKWRHDSNNDHICCIEGVHLKSILMIPNITKLQIMTYVLINWKK